MIPYERWRSILRDEPLPAAICDLDAFDHNQDRIMERLGPPPLTLRVATKSIRVPWLLRRVLDRGGAHFQGLMTFSAAETASLAALDFDDLLLAYPVARPHEARQLADLVAAGTTLHITVDQPGHVQLLARAAADANIMLGLCIDIDMSWRPLSGKAHFGVRRSPIRSAEQAVALADIIRSTPGVTLTALLAYEAQIAGIRGTNPGSRHLDPVRRLIKRRSIPVVAARRNAVLDALTQAGHAPSIVNGGGTGSLQTTSADPSVTEVTVGSGFYCPHLFDRYEDLPLQPAAFFALSVVRASDSDYVTCAGGGYIASGAAGPDRLPIVHLPEGLRPVPMEGFGEVQTPFLVAQGPAPALGDPVVCRHAKAGELPDRFDQLLIVQDGQIIERVPTYRGARQPVV
ncbi:MAG: D-serine deaminase-like pyridoxal phosphate-dependent protein [Myxococcota bacterium]|jgi:D-serine deaminase-like pyridoxal phosphate-dependent protein